MSALPTIWGRHSKRFLASPSDNRLLSRTEGTDKPCCAQADAAFPLAFASYAAYYEVTIQEAAVKGSIGIGVAPATYALDGDMPGWKPNSGGYHGDDGHVYFGSGAGVAYGPTFGAGAMVGCGIRVHGSTQEIFWTLDGTLIKMLPLAPCAEPLVATVGADCKCMLRANFGTAPFRFDLQSAFFNA